MNFGITYNNLLKRGSTPITSQEELIKEELKMLLGLKKHSFFFANNMGLDLERYLYLTNKQATFHLIKEDIEELLNKYKKVTLAELSIEFVENSKLKIIIITRIANTGTLMEIPFMLGTDGVI